MEIIILWVIGMSFTYGFSVGDEKLSNIEQILMTLACLMLWPLLLGFKVNEVINKA